MIFRMNPVINVKFVDFSHKIVLKAVMKNPPLAFFFEQNLLAAY